MLKFVISNYGAGNLRNVRRAFEKFGVDISIINARNLRELLKADAIIFPGVGAFPEAMRNLLPIANKLKEAVKDGKPIFGICLGLQILFTTSHEGGLNMGLSLIKGEVVKINANVKLPHMGWNTIEIEREDPLINGVPNGAFMYFAHTYIPNPKERDVIVAQTEYGTRFPSIIATGNIFATQFHSEKSGRTGLKIIENFVKFVKR